MQKTLMHSMQRDNIELDFSVDPVRRVTALFLEQRDVSGVQTMPT